MSKKDAPEGKEGRRRLPPEFGSNIVGLVVEPDDIDWSQRALRLRVQLHELMMNWSVAADAAPESEVAPILSTVALVLQALHGPVQDADIALFRDRQREPALRQSQIAQATRRLKTIENAVRKAMAWPARSERARQAELLERTVSAHLAPKRGVSLSSQDIDDLARRFVRHVFGQRGMPITRQLTRRKLLLNPFDEGKVDLVRVAFGKIPPAPGGRHDSERFITAGLTALGFKDGHGKNPRGIFDFKKRMRPPAR